MDKLHLRFWRTESGSVAVPTAKLKTSRLAAVPPPLGEEEDCAGVATAMQEIPGSPRGETERRGCRGQLGCRRASEEEGVGGGGSGGHRGGMERRGVPQGLATGVEEEER